MNLNLPHMHKLARKILTHARKAVLGERLGVTIIVHADKLEAGYNPTALISTLPDRAQTRGLLTSVMVGMALADGATPENATELALEDYRKLEDGELTREPGTVLPFPGAKP